MILGATALGALFGRRVRHLSDSLSEPFGVLQGALLGLVGLILAFGLSLSLSRYEDRRAAVVDEANTIGTTYLRAQTLAEPVRSRSLKLLVAYDKSAIRLSEYVPGSATELAVTGNEDRLQRRLWGLAGKALDAEPTASAPRLYTETLNEMIDAQPSASPPSTTRFPVRSCFLRYSGRPSPSVCSPLIWRLSAEVSRGCCSLRCWWQPCCL